MIKKYCIWMEGYKTSGMERNEKATFHGCHEGITFNESCERWFNTLKESKDLFDKENLTFYGCRLFDNEKDARKKFG